MPLLCDARDDVVEERRAHFGREGAWEGPRGGHEDDVGGERRRAPEVELRGERARGCNGGLEGMEAA